MTSKLTPEGAAARAEYLSRQPFPTDAQWNAIARAAVDASDDTKYERLAAAVRAASQHWRELGRLEKQVAVELNASDCNAAWATYELCADENDIALADAPNGPDWRELYGALAKTVQKFADAHGNGESAINERTTVIAFLRQQAQGDVKKAPWSEDEVASLNAYQCCGHCHPFTIGDATVLIATPDGWVKEVGGPVVQDWAHTFMTNRRWEQSP